MDFERTNSLQKHFHHLVPNPANLNSLFNQFLAMSALLQTMDLGVHGYLLPHINIIVALPMAGISTYFSAHQDKKAVVFKHIVASPPILSLPSVNVPLSHQQLSLRLEILPVHSHYAKKSWQHQHNSVVRTNTHHHQTTCVHGTRNGENVYQQGLHSCCRHDLGLLIITLVQGASGSVGRNLFLVSCRNHKIP